MQIAQTNVQLYNQLRAARLPLDDLVLVHRAYEFLTTLYTGHYQADGKPFVAHGVGVASILASLDQPAEIIAVGLLHNIYGNADFGDVRTTGTTPFRRRLVREAMGERIEDLLVRFREQRVEPDRIEEIRQALHGFDETERRLILVELADHLEKFADLGVLYYGENDWVVGTSDRIGPDLIEIANELGEPRLGEMLSTAFAEAAAHAADFPAELRSSDGRRYSKAVVPRSCSQRLSLRVRAGAQGLRDRLRPRTRLRRVLQRAGGARLRA